MPNKKQIPRVGTKLPQKPTPKQDKGGGIFPTAEGACIVFMGSKRRGCKTPPRCLPSPVPRSLSTRGKPAFKGEREMWKGIWCNPLQADHKYVIILL